MISEKDSLLQDCKGMYIIELVNSWPRTGLRVFTKFIVIYCKVTSDVKLIGDLPANFTTGWIAELIANQICTLSLKCLVKVQNLFSAILVCS